MKIRPAITPQADRLERCIALLRQARDLAIEADCPKTVRRIRLALTSAGGAERHMRHRLNRTTNYGRTVPEAGAFAGVESGAVSPTLDR